MGPRGALPVVALRGAWGRVGPRGAGRWNGGHVGRVLVIRPRGPVARGPVARGNTSRPLVISALHAITGPGSATPGPPSLLPPAWCLALRVGGLGCANPGPAGFGGAIGPLEKNPFGLIRWHGVLDLVALRPPLEVLFLLAWPASAPR